MSGTNQTKYQGYAPLHTLKEVARDVWLVDGPEIQFRLGPLQLPFPTRMTIIRLPSGGLWLHSPVAWDEALATQLGGLGPIAHIVAPNTLHYWWLRDWSGRFPAAKVWAVAGLGTAAGGRLPAHAMLGVEPPPAWEGVIGQVLLAGTRITEADFFHHPSRTLILTDLIENFEAGRFRSGFHRCLAYIGGTVDPDGKLPLELRRSFDRTALKTAVEQMIAWAPDRIIIAHGRWYGVHATAELRRAFRWLLS